MDSDDGSAASNGTAKTKKSMASSSMTVGRATPSPDGEASDGSLIYKCDQCDKAFAKQSSLARHRYEHSGE